VDADLAALPDDIDALRAALTIERAGLREVVAERDAGTAEMAVARAKASEDLALIAQQKLRIAKLERQIYGPRSERSDRLIDQLALQFEELEASATEDELAAEIAVANTTTVAGFTRKRAERNTFPEHLPRERVVIDVNGHRISVLPHFPCYLLLRRHSEPVLAAIRTPRGHTSYA
jgi:transposase